VLMQQCIKRGTGSYITHTISDKTGPKIRWNEM